MAIDLGWLMSKMGGGASPMGAKNAAFPEPMPDPTPGLMGGSGGGILGAGSAPPGAGYPYGKGGGGPMTRGGGGRMAPQGMPGLMNPDAAMGDMRGSMNEGVLRGRRAQLEQKRQALMAEIANLMRRMGMYQGEAAAGNPSAQGQLAQIQQQIQAIQMQIQQTEVEMQQLERDFQEAQQQQMQQQGPGSLGARSQPGNYQPGSSPRGPSLMSGQVVPGWMTGKSGGGLGFNSGGGGGGGGSRPPQLSPDGGYTSTPFTSGVGSGSGPTYQTVYGQDPSNELRASVGTPSPYGPAGNIPSAGANDYGMSLEEYLQMLATMGFSP